MKLAVTDANIFIDLIKLRMLDHLFAIQVEIHTTREVVDQLNTSQYKIIETFVDSAVLKVYDFTSTELSAISEMAAPKALEFPDKTVVYLATQLQAIVLSGDGPLRKFCAKSNLEVKGMIWVLTTFIENGCITHDAAAERMEHLLSFNDRLPKEECLQFIKACREIGNATLNHIKSS